MRIHMSSGTTGNPVLNPYTRADIDQWASVMARCYVAAGDGASDVIQQLSRRTGHDIRFEVVDDRYRQAGEQTDD